MMARPIGALELHYPKINDSVFNNLYYPRPSILLSQEKNHLTNKKNRILGVNGLNSKLKHRIAQTSILLGRLHEILESWHNMQLTTPEIP